MKTLLILTKRNSKLFFKDKGMFFSSMMWRMTRKSSAVS